MDFYAPYNQLDNYTSYSYCSENLSVNAALKCAYLHKSDGVVRQARNNVQIVTSRSKQTVVVEIDKQGQFLREDPVQNLKKFGNLRGKTELELNPGVENTPIRLEYFVSTSKGFTLTNSREDTVRMTLLDNSGGVKR